MKRNSSILCCVCFASQAVAQSDFCSQIYGASIVADDGAFLGRILSEYDSDSIFNEFGEYGSKYSSTSIFNQYGEYGGQYSEKSPFNQYSDSGPLLIINGQAVARVTTNEYADGALNPYAVMSCR